MVWIHKANRVVYLACIRNLKCVSSAITRILFNLTLQSSRKTIFKWQIILSKHWCTMILTLCLARWLLMTAVSWVGVRIQWFSAKWWGRLIACRAASNWARCKHTFKTTGQLKKMKDNCQQVKLFQEAHPRNESDY